MSRTLNAEFIKQTIKDAPNRAEGLRRATNVILLGIEKKTFKAEDFNLCQLGRALGMIDVDDLEGSTQRAMHRCYRYPVQEQDQSFIWSPENTNVTTNAFQTITGALLHSVMIQAYELAGADGAAIGDELVTVQPVKARGARIAGITALGSSSEVTEGMPYTETGFEDKYVTSKERKFGKILSITEEVFLFDQTGEVYRRASAIGEVLRQDRERMIVRGVQDADYATDSTKGVYRPSGSVADLYVTTGANKNYIGVSNTTDSSFNAAVPLVDHTDIDVVTLYRATAVKDDRVDGTPRAIAGLNKASNVVLVPTAKRTTADIIKGGFYSYANTGVANNVAAVQTIHANPASPWVGKVLSSPFVDEVDAANWYYGDPKKAFALMQVFPLQTFFQGSDSESAFERDVSFRVKMRFYSGVVCLEPKWFTKVDGA